MREYSLLEYAQMMNNDERATAYHDAIRSAIKPGSVVLEIGSGAGHMALLACKYGARRVYAIEPADAIVVARQAARDNGFADRIVFHRAMSTRLTLPERCDVLISDLRGANAFYGSHLVDLMDARERLLTPDAAWVCQTDTFYAAVAEAPQGRSEAETLWDGSRWGLNLGSALRYAVNNPSRQRFKPDELLSKSEPWARIHYPTLASPHVRGRASLTVERTGPAQGLVLWFEAELHGGARFSNALDKPATVYGSQFLPWPKTVPLQAGDRVEVRIDVIYNGKTYEWNWQSSVWRQNQTEPLVTFKQSTFQGHLFDAETLRRSSANYRPAVPPTLQEERFLLEQIDGQATQGEIAKALRSRFPERFPDDVSALAKVNRTISQLGG